MRVPRMILLFIFLLSVTGKQGLGQETESVVQDLTAAFSTGDVREILDMVDGPIDIALFGSSRKYSPDQASFVLKKFFREQRPQRLDIRDFTKMKRGWFLEGVLHVGRTGAALRVYLRLSRAGDNWRLREIFIDRTRR